MSEEPSEVPEVGAFDSDASDVEGEGDWELSDLTGSLQLGRSASIGVDYDQPRDVCLNSSLFLPTLVVDLTCLAVRSVPAFSGSPIRDTWPGALEAILETSNERISKLGSQVASKDADIAAKVVQVDSLDGRVKISEDGASLMSATIREQGPQLRTAEAAYSRAEVAPP